LSLDEEAAMINADSMTNLTGVGSADALAHGTTGQDAARPQPFSDFSSFQGSSQVGLGCATASADAGHAARSVASFVMEG
jgi:hypothetical protein